MKIGKVLIPMKSTIEKGSAVLELVLIAPIVVLVLVSFFKLFQKTTTKEFDLITIQKEEKEKLRQKQLALPILNRPCAIHPEICSGRKK